MLRKTTSLLILLVAAVTITFAQNIKTSQADWQQRVNNKISVTLDDEDHMLQGHIEMEYVNNSPDDLTKMYIHLWPNAYKNNQTDFALQQLGNGSTDFYFAEEDERGWIDSLDFNVEGESLEWTYYQGKIDIAELKLKEPLKSGDTLILSTPFMVKIPGSFSRFGHVDRAYQITQWYPKPAVYDVNGWNPMPYLDQGEFYSEFGNFEVEITLSEKYIVAATGVLQEEKEWEFIEERIEDPLMYYEVSSLQSASGIGEDDKTITFVQDNVHDFAWFADKTFNVVKSDLQLPSGDTVTTMIFATDGKLTDLYNTYAEYTENTLLHYSKYVGNYPYRYCSVVQGALLAGGGMEYPMVTVIPNLNEEVIVHEVGHNWFYGILGSNERRYPWMDEGINSYFEGETMDDGTNTLEEETDPLGKNIGVLNIANNPTQGAFGILSRDMERMYKHQAIGDSSVNFTSLNYGVMVYGKGSEMFVHLKAYLGRRTFERCFKTYYDEWKFRHPLPGDIQAVFESESGKDLSWFFEDLINSDGILDYKLQEVSKVKGTAVIENKGDINAPFPIDYILGDKIVKTQWIDGFDGKKEIELLNAEYDALKIDAKGYMMETYTKNNTYRFNSTFNKIEPFRLNFAFGIEDPNRTQLAWSPAYGWNEFDGSMIGLMFNNITFPRKNLEFITANIYGLNSKKWSGISSIRYTKYNRTGKLASTTFGVNAAAFSHRLPGLYEDVYQYRKFDPYVRWELAKPYERSKKYRSIELKAFLIDFIPQTDSSVRLDEIRMSDTSRRTAFDIPNGRAFLRLRYSVENNRVLNPYDFRIDLESGFASGTRVWLDSTKTVNEESFVKIEFTGNYRVSYPFEGEGLDIRVFTGAFLSESPSSAFQFTANNTNSSSNHPDYKYEQMQMGRGAQNGIWTQQLMANGPFLKNVGLLFLASEWIAAVNLETEIPNLLGVGVYTDIFTFNDINEISYNVDENPFGYSGGVFYRFGGGLITVYAPLFQSQFITDAQEFVGVTDFLDQVTFTLNLNLFDPFGLRDKAYRL